MVALCCQLTKCTSSGSGDALSLGKYLPTLSCLPSASLSTRCQWRLESAVQCAVMDWSVLSFFFFSLSCLCDMNWRAYADCGVTLSLLWHGLGVCSGNWCVSRGNGARLCAQEVCKVSTSLSSALGVLYPAFFTTCCITATGFSGFYVMDQTDDVFWSGEKMIYGLSGLGNVV